MQKFDHKKIEKKWRNDWEESKIYKAKEKPDPSKKYYILPQLPYPSGSGLHVGHAEGYTACDIFARYKRMSGFDVLQVIGWDSFGLPAENYAIKTNIHPRQSTDQAINNFREQIKSLGLSLDWDREVGSHNPDYYKFTQWFFLLMLERGLAYRKKQIVNWCDQDKTVLANEQVEDGLCERCGSEVELREMEQWYLKITDYAERLHTDLDKVDWPEETIKRQRDWIGKSEGAVVKFPLEGNLGEIKELEVFTTAHDTIYGVTFMAIAPEHKLIDQVLKQLENSKDVESFIKKARNKTELERQQNKDKSGLKLEGINAINPINGSKIPVFVADYVLVEYGSGAIMAVPGHDDRDYEFANKHDLEIKYLTKEQEYVSYSQEIKSNLEKYSIANSDEFDGLSFAEARPAILEKLTKSGTGYAKTAYKLRDWSVSRQRFWGAPIPVVYDPQGEIHPLKLEDLPVLLPDDVEFVPTGQSPLTYSAEFQKGVERKYGKGWKREVDTLDTFMCSSWYYLRYIDPHNENEFASKEALNTWMPVDFYIGGPEHVNGHLLYSRFFTKVLFDAGYIKFDEPFIFHRHQGLIHGEDGRKMSKRWGNVINPLDVIEKYGADTTRMYEMFMGPLEQDKSWNDNAVQGVRRFLQRVNDFSKVKFSDKGLSNNMHKLISRITKSTEEMRFNVAIADFMKQLNIFEDNKESVSLEDWKAYLLLLAPYAPFLTEEIWSNIDSNGSIHLQRWPSFDSKLLFEEEVTIAIQVNGKLRDTLNLSSGTGQADVEAKALALKSIQKHIAEKPIRKVIYVQDKILNIVT
ncbi:MAG: leucine--tRNA ligase [Candidatus Dojkabacteria bacterium]|nr:MAG: leucine--tRNA ligase [Candidatus Dojkabacteria bacterium]